MTGPLTDFQRQVLRAVAASGERLIPSSIGYLLIDAGHIVPRRTHPSAQGAAMMVIRPLAKLEKMKLIDYADPEYSRRGYSATLAGREYLAVVDHEA